MPRLQPSFLRLWYFFHQTVFHHFIYALVDAGVEFFPVVIQDEVSEVIGGCFFPLFFVVAGNAFAGELIVFQGANDALDIVGMDFFGGFRIYGGQTGVKGFGAFFDGLGFQFRTDPHVLFIFGEVDVVEQCLDVEAGAAGQDGDVAAGPNVFPWQFLPFSGRERH